MSSLKQLVSAELSVDAAPQVHDFANHIASTYPNSARAVLFYGSCLRSEELEGQMLDFYLIVSSYEEAYDKGWMIKANKMLPPNVFPFQYEGLIAKVAVLSLEDFSKLNRREASAVSVWARFSQPSRLLWCADQDNRNSIISSISCAAPTLLNAALAHIGRDGVSINDLWQAGYQLTYGAELRAERKERPASVIEFDQERYAMFGRAALHHTRIANIITGEKISIAPDQDYRLDEERKRWPGLRRRGKMLTIARLAKASLTYANGIDYLAWKINRHAGTDLKVRDWQRKWPILGAITLLPKLLVKGAVK